MSTSRKYQPPRDEREIQPLPREIYMRRRIAAGVALVLIIALVWFLVHSLTAKDEPQDNNANQAAQSETIDATSPVDPPNQKKDAEPSKDSAKSSEKASESSSKDADKSGEPSDSASAKDTCTVADLKVTASPSQPTFDADTQPSFYVNIKNPTRGDCQVDFESNPLKFEVFTLNNYQRVWGDLDCNKPEVTGKVDIKAGDEVNYQLGAWSRTTSAEGQCDNRQPVGAGSYLLYGHVGDNVSEPATFNLA